MKEISALLTALALSLVSTITHSYDFNDSFESGDLSSTNAHGFSWKQGTRGSGVFNDQGLVWYPYDANGGVQPPEGYYDPPLESFYVNHWQWAKTADSDWTARTGSHVLNFIYANKDFSERRFDLGVGLDEVWISYWIRVPTNFSQAAGECGSSSAGNKWFALWQDEYSSGDGSSILLGYGDTSPAGNASVKTNWSMGCQRGIGSTSTENPCNLGVDPQSTWLFDIRSPEDQGRWMQMVYHFRLSSGVGVEDGLWEVYHRWEGDPSPVLKASIPGYWHKSIGIKAGYIMGDAGLKLCEQTEWLIDDFTVSDKPLLSVDTGNDETRLADPLPPNDIN